MHLGTENGAVLAVCANPAWQKSVRFAQLTRNEVNRAASLRCFGGGKGINVTRVLRRLGYPVTIGTFLGGHSGDLLEAELRDSGAEVIMERLEREIRTCTTVICEADHSATELIEPSPQVPPETAAALRDRLVSACPAAGAVCLAGSRMPGVGVDFYADIAAAAHRHGVPLLLDDVKEISAVLATGGVTMLKVNAAELRRIVGAESASPVPAVAASLFNSQRLQWLAVTDGPSQAWLFAGQGRGWCYAVPPIARPVSAIGCGDCVAAIMSRRLSERPSDEAMASCFAEALGCASASCLTETPSVFNPADVVLPDFQEISF